MTKRMSLARRT